MEKRKIIIGTYDTAAQGWTLSAWKLSPAEQKTKYLDKPDGDGAWDLSTALTDGVPIYNTRTLTATFECSEGNRMSREEEIRRMINQLDGMRERIILPDNAYHYITGRVHVEKDYNDLAHAAVKLTAVCEPWKYANTETVVAVALTTEKQTVHLINGGRRTLVPEVKVDGELLLEYGTASIAMNSGTYKWPNLVLTPGSHDIKVSGTGTAVITYREAVLE